MPPCPERYPLLQVSTVYKTHSPSCTSSIFFPLRDAARPTKLLVGDLLFCRHARTISVPPGEPVASFWYPSDPFALVHILMPLVGPISKRFEHTIIDQSPQLPQMIWSLLHAVPGSTRVPLPRPWTHLGAPITIVHSAILGSHQKLTDVHH
jgi:hypothetical protein